MRRGARDWWRAAASAEQRRALARWGLYRLRGGGPAAEITFAEAVAGDGGAEVGSLAELLEGPAGRPRLWHARPSETMQGAAGVLGDLCIGPDPRWQPWRRAAHAYESAPLSYWRARDVLLNVLAGAAFPRWGTALRETLGNWSPTRVAAAGVDEPDLARALRRLARMRPGRVVPGPALSICEAYAGSYGHWIADTLPAVHHVREAVIARRLRLVTRRLETWQRRTLTLLGVPPDALLEYGDGTVLCDDLICHSHVGIGHAHRPGPELDAVYARLRRAARPRRAVAAPRHIYVSRRGYSSHRAFENEAELEDALVRLGFVAVRPESLSVDEQITTFAGAEIVVAPHGSALANIGFAPPGCLVIDIVPDRMPHPWIYGLVGRLGHRLVVIAVAHDQPREPDNSGPRFRIGVPLRYRVEPRLVLERLDAARTRAIPA